MQQAGQLLQEISLQQVSMDVLDRLSTYVYKSLVFADDKFAEILHWHGGVSLLLSYGATGVREFSSFESGEENETKATLFLSQPLIDDTLDTLHDIVGNSCFTNVTIVTNVHPMMQAVASFKTTEEDAAETVAELERQMAHCSGKLIYIPVVAAPVLPDLFTLPGHSSFFPLLPTDLNLLSVRHKLVGQQSSEIDFSHLPKQLQLKYKLLVSSLNSLAEVLSLSEDIFSVGTTSGIVADELASLPWSRSRRKMANRKASLLLIDRTLDIASVVHHGFESLLDRIFDTLPRLHEHSVDVCVDMSPVCSVISNPGFSCLAPGCLSHSDDQKCVTLLNAIALLRQKEVTSELNRRLVEALEKEGLIEKTDQSNTLDVMQHYISLFKCNWPSIRRNSALLQLSLAVQQTLRSRKSAKVEKFQIIEKQILQSYSNGDDDDDDYNEDGSWVAMILRLLREFENENDENRDGWRLDDLLQLLLYSFSLDDQCGQSLSSRDETQLEIALTKILLKEKLSENSHAARLVKDCRTEAECLSIVQELMDKLKGLSGARKHLQKYKCCMDKGTVTSPAAHRPIAKQVVHDVLDPNNKQDLVDVIHKSSGIGDFIKSGFGFFRGSSKPRPADHPLLLIFFIGGLTGSEVKHIESASRGKSKIQVMIGGTTMVTPEDVLHLALLQDNLQAR